MRSLKHLHNQPLVSVIMPAYNVEKYISQAIESILNQTYKNFEFIIVDDASTDNTWKIIQKYKKKDKRIIIIQNKINVNVSQSLNTAIKITKGKYIARMDADDWSYPYRLEKQVKFMEKNPKVVISGGTMLVCDKNLKLIYKRSYPLNNNNIRKIIFRSSPFSHPTIIYQSKFIIKINGYKNISLIEDLDLYLRIGYYGQFANISDIIIKHRTRDISLTNTNLILMEKKTLFLRWQAYKNYGYKPTFIDIIYNIIEFLSLFFIPPKIKRDIFNKYIHLNQKKED